MTSSQQRAALQRQIWQIANDVRGAVDGWDFKQYVLGTLFYRFISENFATYIEGGDDSIDYAKLDDAVITPEIKDDAVKTKGYFIYPSQLFAKVVACANTSESLNTDLAAIFAAIESSANGYPSEQDIKGLFADFDTTSNRLGNTVKDKNARLADVLKGVEMQQMQRLKLLQRLLMQSMVFYNLPSLHQRPLSPSLLKILPTLHKIHHQKRLIYCWLPRQKNSRTSHHPVQLSLLRPENRVW